MNVQEIISFLEQKNFKSVEFFEDQILADWGFDDYWLNVSVADGWFRCVLSEAYSGSTIVDRLFLDLETGITSLAITAAVDLAINSEKLAAITPR